MSYGVRLRRPRRPSPPIVLRNTKKAFLFFRKKDAQGTKELKTECEAAVAAAKTDDETADEGARNGQTFSTPATS